MKIFRNSLGIILAIICCGILIYAFETNRSFLQIIIAFVALYFPIAFISSINEKVAIFLFTSFLIIGSYICFRHQLYDTGFGAALAIFLGGATYIFRVSRAKIFDSSDYKSKQKEKRNGK